MVLGGNFLQGKCILSYKKPTYRQASVRKSICKFGAKCVRISVYVKCEFGYQITDNWFPSSNKLKFLSSDEWIRDMIGNDCLRSFGDFLVQYTVCWKHHYVDLYLCGLWDTADWLKILSSMNFQWSNMFYEDKMLGPHLLHYGEIFTFLHICKYAFLNICMERMQKTSGNLAT